MSNYFESIKKQGAKLETPFTTRHVEGHLFFGPMSRYIPVSYLALFLAGIYLISGLINSDKHIISYIGSILDSLLLFTPAIMLFPMTCKQQAIAAWAMVKVLVGFVALMLATFGAGVSFLKGQGDAWPNLILGLTLIPGIEFVPNFTRHQKYITLTRIFISIPCIYYGVKSGNWHW